MPRGTTVSRRGTDISSNGLDPRYVLVNTLYLCFRKTTCVFGGHMDRLTYRHAQQHINTCRAIKL